MNYFDNQKEFTKKGIDYDLVACLECNPQSFVIEDVDKVLAVYEGERDERDWRWVLKLTKEAKQKHGSPFVYLQGGCDYTGWDCRSSADSFFCKTIKEALGYSKDEKFGNSQDIYEALAEQVKTKKSKTWREEKSAEFDNDLPKI